MTEQNFEGNLHPAFAKALAEIEIIKRLSPEQRKAYENDKITKDAQREVANRAGHTPLGNMGWYRKP